MVPGLTSSSDSDSELNDAVATAANPMFLPRGLAAALLVTFKLNTTTVWEQHPKTHHKGRC